jgi:hypothetical protein
LSFSLKLISSQAVGMGNPPWNAGFPNELADVANGCCVQLPVTHRCKVGAPAPVPQFYCVEGGKIARSSFARRLSAAEAFNYFRHAGYA